MQLAVIFRIVLLCLVPQDLDEDALASSVVGPLDRAWFGKHCLTLVHLFPRWPEKCIKCSKHSEGRKSCVMANEGVITFQTVGRFQTCCWPGQLAFFLQGNTIEHCLLCVLLGVLLFVCVEAEGAGDRGVHTSLRHFVGSTCLLMFLPNVTHSIPFQKCLLQTLVAPVTAFSSSCNPSSHFFLFAA